LSGPSYGYDPETGKLYHIGDGNPGGYHMVISFGAPQVWMELAELLEDEEWVDMLAEFGEFYVLSNEEKINRTEGEIKDSLFSWPMFASGMVAYAAARKKDAELANTAWTLLLDKNINRMSLPIETKEVESWRRLNEIPWVSTNAISQWCLNTIVALELIGDMIPEEELQKSIGR
jgi:hypothetical protein